MGSQKNNNEQRQRRKLRSLSLPGGLVVNTNASFVVITCIIFFSACVWTPCDSVGLHKEGNDYCYDDPECGPGSDHWGDTCQNGLRQSPIALPIHAPVLPGVTPLQLSSYRSEAFRMQNNGHTVHIEFLGPPDTFTNALGFDYGDFNEGGGGFAFPDPLALARFGRDERIHYKFDRAHFHWGVRDDVGSEHCFDHRCFSMELHLVHYLNSYETMEEATQSGDKNALAVIAVMLDVSPVAGPGNPVLAPIVNNLFQIEESSRDEWANINAPLDFTPLLATRGQNYMYTYKGSLTTPDCNEQVNWYVFKRPIAISHSDVKGFRFLRDHRGEELTANHRPLQPRNGRPVFLSAIKPISN